MGAAGFVDVYDRDELERLFTERYPDNNLTDDWWYLDTITFEFEGRRLIFDYGDDQGIHEGSENSFWFAYDKDVDGKFSAFETTKSQERVLSVLRDMKALGHVEVWT